MTEILTEAQMQDPLILELWDTEELHSVLDQAQHYLWREMVEGDHTEQEREVLRYRHDRMSLALAKLQNKRVLLTRQLMEKYGDQLETGVTDG